MEERRTFVAYARDKGVPVRLIWPEGARRD
jgi:hypothetical protein